MSRLQKSDIFPNTDFHINETLLASATERSATHRHDFYEIFIVEEGCVEHAKNGVSERLTADSISFIFPDDRHSFAMREGEAARFVNLAFEESLFREALSSAALTEEELERASLDGTAYLPHSLSRQFISRLFWLRNESLSLPEQARRGMLKSLLADMLTACVSGDFRAKPLPQWLKSACEEMRRPQNFILGLHCFVALSGKTQEHLTRSMKKHCGITPSEFITALRLEQAAEELLKTKKSVFEIMLDCGFQNVSYFNKRFKEKFHTTPTKYRLESYAIIGKSLLR